MGSYIQNQVTSAGSGSVATLDMHYTYASR